MKITINVARSADEAERLARGEDVMVRREEGAEDTGEAAKPDAAEAAAEKFLEPEAVKAHRTREAAPEGEAEPETAEQEEKPEKPAKAAKRAKTEKKS